MLVLKLMNGRQMEMDCMLIVLKSNAYYLLLPLSV